MKLRFDNKELLAKATKLDPNELKEEARNEKIVESEELSEEPNQKPRDTELEQLEDQKNQIAKN